MTKSDKIISFLKSHPLISMNALEKKLKLPQGTLSKGVNAVRAIPVRLTDKIEGELKNYGYKNFNTKL